MLHPYCQIILLLFLNMARKSAQQNGGFIWPSSPKNTVTKGEISNIIFDDSDQFSKNFVPAQASRSINIEQDSTDFVFPNDNNRYPNNNNPFQQQTNPDEGRQFNGNVPSRGPNGANENARIKCEHNCLSTSQYDPVCGDDKKTYHNEGKLRCAQRCGKNVRIISRVPCPTTK